MGELFGLFVSAFVAATLLPAQSEALLVILLLAGEHGALTLLLVATIGNTLGSVVNWWLGRHLMRFRQYRWFPFKPASLEKAQQRFQRYGQWSLLLSWMPILGDPLTVVAGLLGVSLRRFVCLVMLAKLGRYLVLVVLTISYS